MNQNYQYSLDTERLTVLIERHTDIPKERVSDFIASYGIKEILPCANILCETENQRERLTALFEFKNLYETVKSSEASKEYHIDSTDTAKDYFRNYFADTKDKEYIVAAYLNTNMNVIATKAITSGTLDQALLTPREIIKEALFCNAHSVIIAHNHPGGSLNISAEDKTSTNKLLEAVGATGVILVDHIIVAGDNAVSLAEHGYITQGCSKQDIAKTATSLSEKSGDYSIKEKPMRIKDQLALAEIQLNLKSSARKPQTANRSHEER